ncbi:hypothetical protein BpHYR1_024385 [Brachionus plicatilis]|uniref:Uncharacterized protein n=1 Tax=Brachionus plicatilis TaxID=10195 RepID=A0A3M7PCY2_BRAPC|nr:hypothetical protein BpHYR1_024385 [Brachionus plicatilis]
MKNYFYFIYLRGKTLTPHNLIYKYFNTAKIYFPGQPLFQSKFDHLILIMKLFKAFCALYLREYDILKNI